MTYLLKKMVLICFILIVSALIFFILIWYSDGLPVAISFFVGIDILVITDYLSFLGIGDYILALIVCFILILVFETFIGRNLSDKRVRVILDIFLGAVGLIGSLSILV